MFRLSFALVCGSFLLHAEEGAPLLNGTIFNEPSFSSPSNISPPAPSMKMPPTLKKTKSPAIAVCLSSLIPGLGHYYLGDYRVGNELLGGALLGATGAVASRNDEALYSTSLLTIQGISFYSVFAAYRDTKLYNGNPSSFLPREDFKALSSAPFQWSVLKKPAVWGGILSALAIGATISYFGFKEPIHAHVRTKYFEPVCALPVAIGEEAMFRGFIQTAFIESMSPWAAITLSSLVFGAAHIPNALKLETVNQRRYYAYSIPFITGFGAYMGWLTYKNHSLKEGVALHMWYDFAIMLSGALVNKAALDNHPTTLYYSFDF